MFSDLAVAMGEAHDLEEVLVVGIVESASRLEGHRALCYLLEHEPEVLLPHLCFDSMDRVLAVASSFAAPFLGRWLEPDQAARAGVGGPDHLQLRLRALGPRRRDRAARTSRVW